MDKREISELIQSSAKGDLKRVQELVSQGVNPSSKNVDNRSPLHLASSEGHLDVVKYLIEEKKVDVNVGDRHGNTPLFEAQVGEHQEVVDYIKSKGGSLIAGNDETNGLCDAVFADDIENVREMIKGGVDVNAPNQQGSTALHIAALNGRLTLVEELLKNGAQVNITNRWGYTPLQDAIRNKQKEVKQFLLENGAVVADINKYKKSDYFLNSLRKTINLLADKDDWDYAGAWTLTDDSLYPIESWFSSTKQVNKLASFRQGIEAVVLKLNKENLVGRAALSKDPENVEDNAMEKDVDYLDKDVVKEVGLKSSMAVPILYNDEVLAVIEFRSFEPKKISQECIEEYATIASRMVVGTIRAEGGVAEATFLRGVFADQLNTVYELIVQEKAFSEELVRSEVEWFYHGLGLNEFYFDHFSPNEIAKHIISFIAAKIHAKNTGTEEVIRFRSENPTSALYIGPPEDSLDIERTIESKWLGEGYEGSSELETGTAPSVKYFLSQGTASPTSNQKLAIYIVSTHHFVEPDVSEDETDIWKVATGNFLREKSFQARSRYQESIKKAKDQIGAFIEISRPTQRQNTPRDGTVLTVIYKRASTHSFISSLSNYLARIGVNCTRKYIEQFSNGLVAYSFHLRGVHKSMFTTLKTKASLLWILPRTSLTTLVEEGKLSIQETIYAYSAWKFAYHFFQRSTAEFNSLWETFSKDVTARSQLLKLKKKIHSEVASEERIAEIIFQHFEYIKKLYADFRQGFDPSLGAETRRPVFNEELWAEMNKTVISEVELSVLKAFLTFNSQLLKTNFFKEDKTAISYRFSSDFLKDSDYPALPYGIFLIIGAEFRGFHIRFDDVARGGIRLIRSGNKQMFLRNAEFLFDENFNLSYTQQKKNKDIPEGGSKGTVLLSIDHQDKGLVAFYKYIDALLDLLLESKEVIDYHGQPEIIFCGPDEGTAGVMNWAALHAKKRGYPNWASFTTGKLPSLGGIPHDTYGMTTTGVHQHVLGVYRKLGLKEEEITKCQTGGPDGDLGSNEIKISKDKTVVIVDGSGVLYDPEGINREELMKLASNRQMCNHFDKSKLGSKGFYVSVEETNVTLPDGRLVESGMGFRNNFHLDPLFTADLFVPCGGRPESINLNNVDKLFANGVPKFKYIIEGANLFFSQEARIKLEEAGVILIKDSTSNKGGVTSSSLEVLTALAMTDEEYKENCCVRENGDIPEFYKKFVDDSLDKIRENADHEFECIWKESLRTNNSIPKCVLSDIISEKINELNLEVKESELWEENIKLKKLLLSEVLPPSLQELLGLDTIIERLPKAYVNATLGAYISSRYIYEQGVEPNNFAFYYFMKKYTEKLKATV